MRHFLRHGLLGVYSGIRMSTAEVPRYTQVVSFDAMNTLIAPKVPPPNVYVQFAERHGVECTTDHLSAAFPKALREVAKKHPYFGHNSITAQEWWTMVIDYSFERAIGRKLPDDLINVLGLELFEFYSTKEAWKLVDSEILFVLKQLREKGFPLVVISNFDYRLRSLLEQMDILSFFDMVWISGELGFEKPDARIFRLATKYFDLSSPSELLHIGDHIRKDFLGARDFGAKAILFDPLLKEDSIPIRDKISRFKDLSIC